MAIKIAFCLPSLHLVGGMEKVLSMKASYFADIMGYDVTIILTDGKDKSPFFPLSPKVKIVNLDLNYENIRLYPIYLKLLIYSYKQFLYRKRLTSVLKTITPDITVSMLRREINFITKIKDGSKKIGELQFNKQNYRDFNTKGEQKGIKGFFARLWIKQLIDNLRRVDRFVVLSYEDKEKWTELDNISVIYNPLEKIPENYSDCTSKRVIAAGRFVSQKGFDMLLDSWKIVSEKHPDWTLTVYGSGEKSPYYKQIKKNGIEKSCTLHDAVLDLNDKFTESSIFAFSSRFEGFGMVITEAMSCGLPAVAFACPCGPKDIITNDLDGILVKPQDIKALADKICYLIENEDIRKAMGERARERSKQFTIEILAKEWDTLFRSLLADKTD
jgi:glycosyltransferase involved in cell wall biosynthesis